MTKITQILEDAIVGKVIDALLAAGFRLEISDQDGGGLHVYASTEQVGKADYSHWVRLCPGNGVDMIVDYTVNLETVLEPVNEFARAAENFLS